MTKLQTKVRAGSRVQKIFDAPQTPYQRVLDAPDVSDSAKAKLRATHTKVPLAGTLDVVTLKQQIDDLIARIPASKVRYPFLVR